jgi:hypothetical protein
MATRMEARNYCSRARMRTLDHYRAGLPSLRLAQFVSPGLLLGIAHLFSIIERAGEMNPAIRSVTDPGAFRCETDLIAFVSVPDRFGVPVHPFCAAPKEVIRAPLSVFSRRQRPYDTHFADGQIFYAKVGSHGDHRRAFCVSKMLRKRERLILRRRKTENRKQNSGVQTTSASSLGFRPSKYRALVSLAVRF